VPMVVAPAVVPSTTSRSGLYVEPLATPPRQQHRLVLPRLRSTSRVAPLIGSRCLGRLRRPSSADTTR
jgi:hypothetical protein